MVVQVTRLQDGTRKILSIAEVLGVKTATVDLQEIFIFERTGVTDSGKVQGRGSAAPAKKRPISPKLLGVAAPHPSRRRCSTRLRGRIPGPGGKAGPRPPHFSREGGPREAPEALGPGHPEFRARQIYHALYSEKVGDLTQISTLPAPLRSDLAASHTVGLPGWRAATNLPTEPGATCSNSRTIARSKRSSCPSPDATPCASRRRSAARSIANSA